MSGRLLRKVLKEHEQNQKQENNVTSEELEERFDDDESDTEAQPKNPFDLLNDDDDDLGNGQVPFHSFITSQYLFFTERSFYGKLSCFQSIVFFMM